MSEQNTDSNLTRYRRFNVVHNGQEWDGSSVIVPELSESNPEELSQQALEYAHVALAAERATDVDWWLEVLQRHGYFEDLERAVWRLARGMIELGEDDGSDPKPEDIDLGHVCGLAAVRRKVREVIRLEFADPLMRRHFAAFVGINITAWAVRRALST